MIKKLIITTTLIALSAPAYALLNNTTTNNDNSVTNAPVANGGQGGVGIGGKSKSSATGGNASATGGNATQGQMQGQIGINKSSNKNTVNTSDFNANSNKSSSKQSQDASSENDISITGDTYKAAKIPVSTAYAPTILPTSDCLSAASAGASGQFFGFSLGFNRVAQDCNRRADASQWANLGFREVAVARMCQDKTNRDAAMGLCPSESKESRIEEECKYPTPSCKRLKKAL